MRLIILFVGAKIPGWVKEGYTEYARRMPREARVELIQIRPEPRTTGKSTSQLLEAEAQRIFSALPHNCLRIALDERGIQLTTAQLAGHMKAWMREGSDVAFIIGGADGLHDSVKQTANQQMALSALTLPHALARILLVEQLYRSYSLMHNHPYHRE